MISSQKPKLKEGEEKGKGRNLIEDHLERKKELSKKWGKNLPFYL